MITIDGFTKNDNINSQEFIDHFSILGDILFVNVSNSSRFDDKVRLIVSMGTIKQCNLFHNLINETFYNQRKLEVTIHEKFNENWGIFPAISFSAHLALTSIKKQVFLKENLANPLNFTQLKLNSSSETTNYNPNYGTIRPQAPPPELLHGRTPHFRGKIYKPIWSYKKFNGVGFQAKNNNGNYPMKKMNRFYKNQNFMENHRFFQNNNNNANFQNNFNGNQFRPQQERNLLPQYSHNMITMEEIQKKLKNENKTTENGLMSKNKQEDIAKKNALKEKLLNVFKNLSETKFI